MAAKSYKEAALTYVDEVLSGNKKVGKEIVLACARFRRDLKREDLELRTMTGLELLITGKIHQITLA